MKSINYCKNCKKYTLKDECSKCGKSTKINVPARFRKLDVKYSKYRRMFKNE